MDLLKILAELRRERDLLCEAIIVLERLAGKRRRGRPPQWLRAVRDKVRPASKRRTVRADRD